jgi:hypothetical protein
MWDLSFKSFKNKKKIWLKKQGKSNKKFWKKKKLLKKIEKSWNRKTKAN